MKRLKFIFYLAIAAFCGAVAMFGWLTWNEWSSKRSTPTRPPEIVLSEIDQARSDMLSKGVYWFSGSYEDAKQLRDLIETLDPSLRVILWRVDEFDGFPLFSAGHPIFGDDSTSMAEVERILTTKIPR